MAARKTSKKSSKKTARKASRTSTPGGKGRFGDYIVMGGRRLALHKHPTDFSVRGATAAVHSAACEHVQPLARRLTRMSAVRPGATEKLMEEARADSVAHHIYLVADTDEEIVIDDRILLELRLEDPRELAGIARDFHLLPQGRMGRAHVLRVTEATGRNPLKTSNELATREGVASCHPQVMVEIRPHQTPPLFSEQWYLTADLTSHPDLLPDADIQAPEAWQLTTGRPGIVVAVIDDGFDLDHPALVGTALHPDARDFQGGDDDPRSEDDIVGGVNQGDYHGTPVASIAVGSHTGSAMRGIAPGCTFLPIRIGFGPLAAPIDILDVFRYASDRADVVNCSFGTSPRSFDVFGSNFRAEITGLTQTGGRRGKGLVMVFSAANDDAPTFLPGADNANGVRFTDGQSIRTIPAGLDVFSGYPMTEGVVVVAAMSSLKRKSGYSCWGPHITVTAPSNNMHYIMAFVPPGTPGRSGFVASYRGLGQVAAVNRPGHGAPFSPILRFDDPSTPDLQENFYTAEFGGTSGAAPVVTGVVALVLSANDDLSAAQVRQILRATADRDLDPTLDLANDPNVQGLTGDFVDGHSLWFGAGKVNAFAAVSRAKALAPDGGGDGGPTPAPGSHHGEAHPDLPIPDQQQAGVASAIDIDAPGTLRAIQVTVDISHTYRGDLRVLLVTPRGLVAELHRFEGGSAHDLKRSFDAGDTEALAHLVAAGIGIRGRWFLHVADFAQRDVGTLHSWGLDLES